MNNFKKTKIKLSIVYALIFSVFFTILGLSFFTLKYYNKENINVEITEVVDFENTGEGEEIDDIFKIFESFNTKESVIEKKYTYKHYKNDIIYFMVFIFFMGIIFYIVSIKMMNKWYKPVEDNLEDIKNFIDNAGHELKTPLAVIDSSLWLMREKKEFDLELIEKSQKEILRTNKLIETLRDLSNITIISKKEKINISKSVSEIISKYEKEIKNKGINVKINLLEDFLIEVNRNYFDILFSNLISNAIKYNKKSGSIIVTILNKSIVIEDSGEGIPKDKQEKIFNRFYRIKNQKNKEGFGLGLSLVEKIVNVYNWQIKVESEEGVGTKIILKF